MPERPSPKSPTASTTCVDTANRAAPCGSAAGRLRCGRHPWKPPASVSRQQSPPCANYVERESDAR